jgi:predicted nucleotidyltransferase
LLAEVPGDGSWAALISGSREIHFGGRACRMVSLDQLIRLKRAAGRPKDLETIAELEIIRDEQPDQDPPC